jgi:tetratricopeptide (TPR) repeat protein
MRFRDALFETREVRVQRTLLDSGLLLRGSHVIIDQTKSQTFLVGYNGDNWDRLVRSHSFLSSPKPTEPVRLSLGKDTIIGFRLIDHLRAIALARPSLPDHLSYYEPLLDSPVELVIDVPLADTISLHGQSIEGSWIEAKRRHSDRILLRTFFDKTGTLWIEEYPELRQVRHRMPGTFALTTETSELMIGFHSRAYIADPNSATRATFLLSAAPARLDALSLLDEPVNHSLERKAPDKLILEVVAAAPDGNDPPTDSDLGSSKYIRPVSPSIVRALRYLRSAGKRGTLPKMRRFNATTVIARASLIERPVRFWSDPDKVAGLIMHYVSSLLPNKSHTFSMSAAPVILAQGGGDCTEHAVLFASLMRAQGIPTRLVTGMYLTPGGIWAFHMWNAYWNGSSWVSIDPATMSYRTGALYVALGRGSSSYTAVHDRLSDFMQRTFSGISFDLIAASHTGEKLFLARPANPDADMAYLNALVLASRGDHQGALSALDSHISPERRSLAVKLFRIELLVRSGHYHDALSRIAAIRDETSSAENIALLDDLEFDSFLSLGRFSQAETVLLRIDHRLSGNGDNLSQTLLRAKFLFVRNDQQQAISLLLDALDTYPDSPSLLALFAEYVATASTPQAANMIDRALDAALQAVRETMFADPGTLATLSHTLFRAGRFVEARLLLDHALVLAPSDRSIHTLREELGTTTCTEPPSP